MRLPKTHVEVDQAPKTTKYGGLILATELMRRLSVSKRLDSNVTVLKQYQPYTEADHILAQVLNLYVGGTCIEDMSELQQNEAVCRILGACRVPDPTTAGDFLRRFEPQQNPGALASLRRTNDELQVAFWEEKTRGRRKGRKKNKGRYNNRRTGKQELAVLDIDAHAKEVYGLTKEGADFNYKGKWSHHPLAITMAGTNDCLALRNRPGNVRDSEGAAEILDETLDYVHPHFEQVLVRGDSGFDRADLREVCHKRGTYFAFVGREFKNRPEIAASIPEAQWQPFETRARRRAKALSQKSGYRPRKKRKNRRRQRARERGYKNMQLMTQWVAEVPWRPPGSEHTYRLVIRRQLIEHSKGQIPLYQEYRYRYVVTNLSTSLSTERVIDLTYERCDQENTIEQLKNGLAAWRMPVREFAGNCAWLEIARLAWNLAKWLCQLVLPEETVRWEWKRFRRAFIEVPAEVIKRGRQLWIRFRGPHRFQDLLVEAHQRLQC